MKNRLALGLAGLGGVMGAGAARSQNLSADGALQTFDYLSDQFFTEAYFKFSPTAGTSAGLHEYDPKLEDYSAASVERNIGLDSRAWGSRARYR